MAARSDHVVRHEVGISRIALTCRTFTRPHMVEVDGRRLVFWRSDSGIVAMNDVCAHRASPLSNGQVETAPDGKSKCLTCPYHHWQFDSAGRIADVPTEPEGRWPKRTMQRTYRLEFEGGGAVIYDDVDVRQHDPKKR